MDRRPRGFRAGRTAAGILKSLRVHSDHEADHVQPPGKTEDFNQMEKKTIFFLLFKRGKKKQPRVKDEKTQKQKVRWLNSGASGQQEELKVSGWTLNHQSGCCAAIGPLGSLGRRRTNKNDAPPQSPVLLRCRKLQPRAPPAIYGGAEIVSLHCTVIIGRRPFITARRKPYLS